jgi:hypothetical protein
LLVIYIAMQLSKSLITAAVLSFTLSAGFAAPVSARADGSTKQLGNPGSDTINSAGDVGSAGIHGAAMSLAGVRRQGIADGIKAAGDAGSAASGVGAAVGSGISQGLATAGAGAVSAAGQGAAAAAGCKDDNDWSVSCVLSDYRCTMLTIIIPADAEAWNKCVSPSI